MTLLERWDDDPPYISVLNSVTAEEIRRAIAIAQAVEESDWISEAALEQIMRRANELLKDGK